MSWGDAYKAVRMGYAVVSPTLIQAAVSGGISFIGSLLEGSDFVDHDLRNPCVACPTASHNCERNWSGIDDEIQKIGEMEDPIERNKVITGKYKDIAKNKPENRWARLASYVSAQAGCGMEKADGFWAQNLGESWAFDPEKAKAALADGNIEIFKSVARPFLYVNKYGYESFDRCLKAAPEPRIPDELVEAMRIMQEGDLRDAADMIAEHEQRDVVEGVYKKHAKIFADIDAYDTSWKDIGNTTRDLQSIPLSYDCTSKGKVPLEGALSDPDNRVDYYHKLMDELETMKGWK